jgi:ABC-type dipeptide/oligopeptide/nickel transport system ATPase component
MNIPKVEPIKIKEYNTKQSKYDVVARLPFRAGIIGPSGCGKTVLLQNMILDIYKGCFERIYIFSPSIDVDQTWEPVKKYIKNELNINTDKEQMYFSEYKPEDLDNIITTQHKIAEHMKQKDFKKIFQILIIIDDFADSPQFTRHSKLLHGLYTRGRHSFISTITAVQGFTTLASIIRKNLTQLYIYKLRNAKDLETIVEELSAICDKKELLDMYRMATLDAYSFWYINLLAKKTSDMFFIRFDKRLIPE